MPPVSTSQWAELDRLRRRSGLRVTQFPQFFARQVEDESIPKNRVETWLSRPGSQVAIGLFLVLVLVGSMTATLWLVSRTSPLVPKFDDWVALVPAVTGNQPVTWSWLWSQLNEHRVPLPRLALLAAFYCSGGDFRSGAFLNVLILGLASLLLMMFARKCRGRSSVFDAFFPLILLHWGQSHIYFIGITTNFTIPIFLGYCALIVGLESERLSVWRGIGFGLCLLGMPLCGLTGLIPALPLAAWLAVTGLAELRQPGSNRWKGILLLLECFALVAVAGLYFVGYESPRFEPQVSAAFASATLVDRLRTMAVILSMSLGWVGKMFRPYPAVLLLFSGVVIAVSIGFSLRRSGTHRYRGLLLLAWLASVALLIAGVGWGRVFTKGDALWSTTRYATLSIPFLVTVYLVTLVYQQRQRSTALQALLCVLALAVFSAYVIGRKGHRHPSDSVQIVGRWEEGFIRAAANGATPQELAALHPIFGDPVRAVQMLQDAHLGPFELSEAKRRMYLVPLDELELGSRQADSYLDFGWAEPQQGGRWTLLSSASIRFPGEPGQARKVTLNLMPFLIKGHLDRQEVRLLFNRKEIDRFTLDRTGITSRSFVVPGFLFSRFNILTLELPNAMSPAQLGVGPDPRYLGVFVHSLHISPS
jgi:hypothetical protein